MLLRTLYFYCMFQKLQPIAGRLIPVLCSAVLYVLSDNSSTEVDGGNILSSFWSRWSSHPQKVVMSCEMNGFYSSVILRSWHETLYPTPFLLRNTPTLFFFNKSELIDVQKDVFSLPLCSGQWAHAMFIRLKVSHCDERKGEKMQNIKEKPIVGAGSAFSVGLFITNWDQITLEGTREGRDRFVCDLKQQHVVQRLWSELASVSDN